MRKVTYNGDIKIIKQIVAVLNRKAPLPLDQDENVDWGTDGQVYATDGTGGGKWVTPPAAQVQSDWNEADSTKADYIKNKPSDATQSTHGLMSSADKTKLDGIASGAEVNVQSDWNEADSTSDAYIANKPTIPAAQIQSDWTQADNTQADYIKNKPTIPTVNDATLTITQNGSSLGTFTANASANVTIEVPGGGGSGGHTIWNRIKSALTQRGKLWFADASVSDVSADDATKVEVVTELASESAFDNLPTDGSADGIYAFPDSGGEYLTADMVGYDNTVSGLSANDVQGAIDKLGEKVKYKDVASVFTLHSTATAAQKTFFLYGNVLFYTLWVSFSATPSDAIDVVTTTEYLFKPALGICAITNGFANPSDFLGYAISSNKFSINVGNISKIVTGKYYLFTGTALIQ